MKVAEEMMMVPYYHRGHNKKSSFDSPITIQTLVHDSVCCSH